MHETKEDLAELQRLLDESYASAGEHLRSIFVPERRSSAEEIAAALKGSFLINLATVTAKSEPVVAPVDGLFFRGKLWMSLPPGAVRARHLRVRPKVSATYIEGEEVALIVHGEARELTRDHPLFAEFDAFAQEVYGPLIGVFKDRYASRKGPDFTGFIEPRRIYAQGFAKR